MACKSKEHSVKMTTFAHIIEYRRTHEKLISFAVQTRLPTEFGEFRRLDWRSLSACRSR
jgi:3,4-dihydroxy 2-butanone 4-phosphate synthase/GTP cyclohydrolase II